MKFYSRGNLGFAVTVTQFGAHQVTYHMGRDDETIYTKSVAEFDAAYSR